MKKDFCGERGIRTPESLLTITRFPGVPLQPLEHLSLRLADAKLVFLPQITQITQLYLIFFRSSHSSAVPHPHHSRHRLLPDGAVHGQQKRVRYVVRDVG